MHNVADVGSPLHSKYTRNNRAIPASIGFGMFKFPGRKPEVSMQKTRATKEAVKETPRNENVGILMDRFEERVLQRVQKASLQDHTDKQSTTSRMWDTRYRPSLRGLTFPGRRAPSPTRSGASHVTDDVTQKPVLPEKSSKPVTFGVPSSARRVPSSTHSIASDVPDTATQKPVFPKKPCQPPCDDSCSYGGNHASQTVYIQSAVASVQNLQAACNNELHVSDSKDATWAPGDQCPCSSNEESSGTDSENECDHDTDDTRSRMSHVSNNPEGSYSKAMRCEQTTIEECKRVLCFQHPHGTRCVYCCQGMCMQH